MGSGGSKKPTDVGQKEKPKLSSVAEIQLSNRSSQSPQMPAISSRRISVHSRAPSLHSRVSTKPGISNLPNGVERRTPLRDMSNHSPRDSDDVPLPPIDNPINKSNSRASVRASSVVRPRLNSDSSSESLKSVNGKSFQTPHKHYGGRCSHCPHCRGTTKQRTLSTPTPKWLTQNPRTDQTHINMDEYDVEAVKKKIIIKNGHLPGSYDYQPYLTIEQLNDHDQTKGNYFTQPLVANTKPRVLPTSTPFPDYELLQRREQRLNKPFSLPLFD